MTSLFPSRGLGLLARSPSAKALTGRPSSPAKQRFSRSTLNVREALRESSRFYGEFDRDVSARSSEMEAEVSTEVEKSEDQDIESLRAELIIAQEAEQAARARIDAIKTKLLEREAHGQQITEQTEEDLKAAPPPAVSSTAPPEQEVRSATGAQIKGTLPTRRRSKKSLRSRGRLAATQKSPEPAAPKPLATTTPVTAAGDGVGDGGTQASGTKKSPAGRDRLAAALQSPNSPGPAAPEADAATNGASADGAATAQPVAVPEEPQEQGSLAPEIGLYAPGGMTSFKPARSGAKPDAVENMRPADSNANDADMNSCVLPKPIFVISDCTGESAAHTVRASLGQFESCFKLSIPANLIIFRFVDDETRLYDIMKRAHDEDALLVYTLVDSDMVKKLQTAAHYYSVRCVDLWGNLLDNMEEHLDTVRLGVPMTRLDTVRRPSLPPDYFAMIEAVEYTRKMDDGANPDQWHEADLLLLGVSRSGKTPLSIYLGQRGYKVANLPLVPEAPLPRQLFEIDQTRIIGLIIDANLLSEIRRNRLGTMGVESVDMDYNKLRKCRDELTWAKSLYADNPSWPVLDTTLRSVEESAARVMDLMARADHMPWAYGGSEEPRTRPPPRGGAGARERPHPYLERMLSCPAAFRCNAPLI